MADHRDKEDALSTSIEAAEYEREIADRAGAIVTDQVRSIVEAAESRAADILRTAEEDAAQIRREASEVASGVLARIDGIEGQLGDLVQDLRREADRLSANPDRNQRD